VFVVIAKLGGDLTNWMPSITSSRHAHFSHPHQPEPQSSLQTSIRRKKQHNMINPTYLAQRTRSCKPQTPIRSTIAPLTFTQPSIGPTVGVESSSPTGNGCELYVQLRPRQRHFLQRKDADNSGYRRPKSKTCTPSTSPSPHSERKYDRNSRDTDTCSSCKPWMCSCSNHTLSSRYVHHNSRLRGRRRRASRQWNGQYQTKYG
jgi:hypothetical protein